MTEKENNMVEYIERKRAIVDACNALELYPSEYAALENALNRTPTADVAPVRYGQWVCGDYYDVGDVCSECDWDSQMISPSYHYCPNCGARMECNENG